MSKSRSVLRTIKIGLKMKIIQLLYLSFLLIALLLLSACSKDCESDNAVCSHTPPTDELCSAAFQRWFYNADENTCEQIAYSGCSVWGFETLEACQECDCD